jgi:hypothetical protein
MYQIYLNNGVRANKLSALCTGQKALDSNYGRRGCGHTWLHWTLINEGRRRCERSWRLVCREAPLQRNFDDLIVGGTLLCRIWNRKLELNMGSVPQYVLITKCYGYAWI